MGDPYQLVAIGPHGVPDSAGSMAQGAPWDQRHSACARWPQVAFYALGSMFGLLSVFCRTGRRIS